MNQFQNILLTTARLCLKRQRQQDEGTTWAIQCTKKQLMLKEQHIALRQSVRDEPFEGESQQPVKLT